MKLKKFREELKSFLRQELFHAYEMKDILKDPFIYVMPFFFLSGTYVMTIFVFGLIGLVVK